MTEQGDLRERVSNNPGDPVFAELASELIRTQQYQEALNVCLTGLSANPECHMGRLMLGQVYFKLGYIPFAAREIEHLCREFSENTPLVKLYEKLVPGGGVPQALKKGEGEAEEIEIADAEFEIDALSLLDSKETKK